MLQRQVCTETEVHGETQRLNEVPQQYIKLALIYNVTLFTLVCTKETKRNSITGMMYAAHTRKTIYLRK
jgi:hypothetical protein